MATTIKDSRIDVRLSKSQKTLLEQAAAARGKSLSEFMVTVSTEAAEMVLADQNRLSLSEEAMQSFIARLEEPPRVLPKLKALFERPSVLKG